MRLAEALYRLAIAVWVGGLLAVGYLAAPVLFATLDDRALAGQVAGKLFALSGWVGLACGIYLTGFILARKAWRALRSGVFWLLFTMLVLAAVAQFGIQPLMAQMKADALPRQVMESALRDRFATWHGISSALYLVQSLLGMALAILQDRGLRR